jgi:glutathione S-transferase
MLIVHHLNDSRSQRILWLLEELGLPYEIRRYRRDTETMLAPAELRKVHPLGKAPIVEDAGNVLAESGAIIEYLVERYGGQKFAPAPGTPERLRYTYWLHFAEGTAMTPLLLKLIFDRIRHAPVPFFARPIARKIADRATETVVRPNLERILHFVESELGRDEWFAGSAFSAADVQMSFPLEAAQARGGLDGRFPVATAWLARIHARPAYRRAIEAGGEYRLLR